MGASRSFLWLAIVILLLAFTVVAVEEASSAENDESQPIQMFPLTKRDLDEAFGLKKRSDYIDLASLSLADEHELFFGGLSEDGQILLANMTLKAPQGQRMVMMEHFEELFSNHNCHKDSGYMTLTFNSREAFKHAMESWSHVNSDTNEQFIIIANHDGCGPDFERQPYVITGIDHHEERMETRLTARSVSFPDTFGTYSIEFGKALPTKKFAHKLFKRFVGDSGGILSQTKTAMANALKYARKSIEHAGNAMDGDFDVSRNYKTDISMGNPGELRNVFMDMFHQPSRIIVNCLDCYVRGTLEMSGFVEVEDGLPKNVSVQFVATNFRVKFDIESRLIFVKVKHDAIVEIHLSPPKGVPGLSLNFTNFISLGLVSSWTAQLVPLFIGVTNFTAGIDATIPDGAKFSLINYPNEPSGSGFEGGVLDTHFNVRQSDAICKIVVSSTPKFTLEVDLHKVGRIESHAVLAYPEYGFDIDPRIDKGGACNKELGAGTAGVSVNGVIDVTFNIITAAMYRNKPFEITDWRIFFNRTRFLQQCLPLQSDRYEVGDSPAWLTETGFKSEEDGLPAEFTSAFKGEQTNENAEDREVAISGSAAAAPRLKARSLFESRPIRAQRRSREFLI